MKRSQYEKFMELLKLLEKYTYITTDDFSIPDVEYLYIDNNFLNPIRLRRSDDFRVEFNISPFINSIFRPVNKKYENNSHLNEY